MTTLSGEQKTLHQSTVDAFATVLDGDVIRAGDARHDDARALWNGMIDRRPALIAQCAREQDVVRAVSFARENQLLVAVRGGGHNVAGHAGCDDGLVIDLTHMNHVTLDPDARVLRAGGGATIADLDTASQPHGLAVPMGVVSKTGIAGLTLGGGIGWLRRKYGLSCDNMLSARLVTASGDVITASEDEHPDLFWALKGGGGNFGVVTEFEFRLHPVGPEVMFVFTLYHGSKRRAALRYYRDYCAQAPDEVSSFAICGNVPDEEDFPAEIHGEPYILFAALYAGSPEDGQRVLQPLREFDDPLVDFSEPMSYLDAQTILDADYPDGIRYYWKSLNLEHLSDEVIDRLVQHDDARPSALSTVDVWHMGGAISRVDDASSSFGGRQAAYLLGVEGNWIDPAQDEANIAWARNAVKDMQVFSDGSQYLNFPGFLEGGDQLMQTTFGRNYQRLVALKTRYDPGNLFRLNQNIAPAQA